MTKLAILAVLFLGVGSILDWLNHSGLSDLIIAVGTILIFSACTIAVSNLPRCRAPSLMKGDGDNAAKMLNN